MTLHNKNYHSLFGRRAHKLGSVRALACVAVLSSTALFAQAPTASLSGTVHDRTGAVIQNATVELRNSASGDTRRITSNSSGVFSFQALQSGNYDVIVSASGF